MKALITGAGGFVGKHLLHYLHQQPNITLHGTIVGNDQRALELSALVSDLTDVDLRDEQAVFDLLDTIKPDQIFHLAGQAFVPRSFEDPWDTLETNIRTTLNLLQGIIRLKLQTRILVVSSAEVYGAVRPEQLPLTENTPLAPANPYSVSKVAQDLLAQQYTFSHKVETVRVRPFNHIGPGQNERFSVPNWALQIAEAEAGQREPVVFVGNLSAARDFTDVRDVVRSYGLAMNKGLSGAVYNVCSGQSHTMQEILDTLVSLSSTAIDVRVDPERFRAVDVPLMIGDYSKIHTDTGWKPEIPLEQSLRDVLEEQRHRVKTQLTNTP